MPVVTVQQYLKDRLNGLALPIGLGNLTAQVRPPAADDGTGANAYVWGSAGDEARQTFPRAQHLELPSGGNKMLTHRTNVWLVFFADQDAPNADLQFPAIVDFVMATLRNVEMLDQTQHAQDPITGQLSNLLNVGENMSWEQGPVRATAEQRYLRYDGLVNVEVIEIIQA